MPVTVHPPPSAAQAQADQLSSPLRLIVADVDDTFTFHGSLHPAVLSAVARASQAGLEVILNTGRPAGYGATLLAYVAGVSAVIVENGGAWFDRQAPGAPPDPHEVPICYRTLAAPDLRARLADLAQRVGLRAGLSFVPTADNAFRVTDYTVLRRLPADAEPAAVLRQLGAYVAEESDGRGQFLASSIHLHFMLDGQTPRSKADGVAALLRHRGVADPYGYMATSAVSVGDSANDSSLFSPGRFALSVGVANIRRYLPELGPNRPRHITTHAEGLGLVELIDAILAGTPPSGVAG